MCRERLVASYPRSRYAGSSPRVRGTLATRPPTESRCRFIPACAGNAALSRGSPRALSVHPRVCGERHGSSYRCASCIGSSPRVRGTPLDQAGPRDRRRFIPACAGNANTSQTSASGLAVHPRVCGERIGAGRMILPSSGSSPRVRGTPLQDWPSRPRHRFIPACAGNAYHPHSPISSAPVHPRVCGERLSQQGAQPLLAGSSPRVRGTHLNFALHSANTRFIPACAGNAV